MLSLKKVPVEPLVAASILSADFGYMIRDAQDVLNAGADLLHVDVMDGHFVPNLTMGVDMIRALRRHLPDTYLDVHLMVQDPGLFIDMYGDAGANALTFHVEVCRPMRPATLGGWDPAELIGRIKARGMDAGLVVNPPTPLAFMSEAVGPWLNELDLLLVMSVNPGRSGQAFIPQVLDKVRWLKQRLRPDQRLEIDGGISPRTVGQATEAGVDMLVTASALFGSSDRAAVIRSLKQS